MFVNLEFQITSTYSFMKKKLNIWSFLYISLGFVMIFSNSCKKENTPITNNPAVTTTEISNISRNTASSGGRILLVGNSLITERGICWNTQPNPILSDNKSTDTTSTESFTSQTNGLKAHTTYSVRAYATTGDKIVYGNNLTFTTLSSLSINKETVTDIDGNIYHTVTIGTQTWMTENLRVTHYNNGIPIDNVTENIKWFDSSYPYGDYNNDPGNSATYGRLYKYTTVINTNKIAPTGWHVSSYNEWISLTNYLSNNGYGYQDSQTALAKALASNTGWNSCDTLGTAGNDPLRNNSTGFNALPAGGRYLDGKYLGMGQFTTWWTSTISGRLNAWYVRIGSDFDYIYIYYAGPDYGSSVRCVKD